MNLAQQIDCVGVTRVVNAAHNDYMDTIRCRIDEIQQGSEIKECAAEEF